MPGEDKCHEVSIVGGTYQETCYWPEWDELFGSGWRAVRVMRTLCPEVQINYCTVGDEQAEKTLKLYAASEKLRYELTRTSSPIKFYYNHPLATPIIQRGEQHYNLNVNGKHVVVFGMLEATAQIDGEWVVYDPQSPLNPISFREQGGKAAHLALVLNKSEAKRLSEETELDSIKKALFEKEGCECLVVKCGAEGAKVYASVDDEGTVIPIFKTHHVWPIGSGDVFTTVFAYYWFAGSKAAEAALNASRAVAAYCEGQGDVDRVADAVREGTSYEEFVPKKKGLVYLAGPFFTLSEKLFVSDCRNLLKAMGVDVFSPYHDVGEGMAEDVAPKDIEHLKDCSCVFAIVDGLDSGTLFEVGYAVSLGKKVVAYVENETEGALKMLAGTGCGIEKDFTTAMYRLVGMQRNKKAILLSGGMDSIALAYWLRPEIAITLDYGQRAAEAEIKAAAKVAGTLGIEHSVISVDCSSLGSGDLVGTAPLGDAPITEWWPYRNQMLVTLALMKAIQLNVCELMVGSVKTDAQHSDGTQEFYEQLSKVVEMQEGGIKVTAPAIGMTTVELVKKGGVPESLLMYAHSCHTGNVPCGRCHGCYKYMYVKEQLGIL